MSRSDNYIAVLLEEMDGKLNAIGDIAVSLANLPQLVSALDARLRKIESDITAIKADSLV